MARDNRGGAAAAASAGKRRDGRERWREGERERKGPLVIKVYSGEQKQ